MNMQIVASICWVIFVTIIAAVIVKVPSKKKRKKETNMIDYAADIRELQETVNSLIGLSATMNKTQEDVMTITNLQKDMISMLHERVVVLEAAAKEKEEEGEMH